MPILRPGLSPPPIRCRVRLSYRGKAFASVALEVSADDGNTLADPEIVPNAADLHRVLLGPAGRVIAINIHHQVAQKIHACTEIPTHGPNHRVHDLYDLMLLDPLVRGRDLTRTRIVCEETFARRSGHLWPPVLPDWADWPVAWSGLDIPGPTRPTYEEARTAVSRLIDDIRRA